ncbi:hypothetical protein [Halalkalibacter sp. APA_J-10(15)]|nr:hypothetical protein [Halalkalibacter sp. APA_J-10(15)]MCK0472218.1 hypothetical protein [Halalkalibacter sp. APA_J-10(15)]
MKIISWYARQDRPNTKQDPTPNTYFRPNKEQTKKEHTSKDKKNYERK